MNSFPLHTPPTTTTTIPLNTATTLPLNVPRSPHENKNQIKHLSTPNNMMNNTKNNNQYQKWKSNNRSRISYKYNRIHYKRYSSQQHYHQYNTPPPPPQQQHIGILKWFNEDTKYGFIAYKNQDLFVHESAFINISLPTKINDYMNQSVTFNIDNYIDKKTLQNKQKAINVNITNVNIKPITHTSNNNNNNNNRNNNGEKGEYFGILLWFNEEKKFGFIKCDNNNIITSNNNNDLFVYESELQFDKTQLYKGMKLQFNIESYFDHYGKRKKKAINVDIINHSHEHDSQNRNLPMQVLSGRPWVPNIRKHPQQINSSPLYRRHYTFRDRVNSMDTSPAYEGYLLWFDHNKKHGFIFCDDINIIDDVFVYETDFLFPKYLIEKDMRLLFDIKIYNDSKGIQKKKAIKVIIDDKYNNNIIEHNHASKFEQNNQQNQSNSFSKQFQTIIQTQTQKTEIITYKNNNGNVIKTNVIQTIKAVTEMATIKIEEKKLSAEAAPFIPESFISKPKQVILEPIIETETENEEEIMIENIIEKLIKYPQNVHKNHNIKKKRVKKNKNKFELLFELNDYKKITNKLIEIFNQKQMSIMDIYNRLYTLPKTYRNKLFLDVNLEFLSLLEDNKSILNVMYYINQYKNTLIDQYFEKLLLINTQNIIETEFIDYGLKCVYPSENNNKIIRDLINKNSTINEFMEYKCYNYLNYFGMYEILDYLLVKYIFNNENELENDIHMVYKFMELMVIDLYIDDFDNNDKLLFLSIIVTIFHKYNMFTIGGELFCNFIRELISKDIISYDVIDKWRLDEYDILTNGKKNALILLTDLIHELQNKEIKDNIIQEYLSNTYNDSDNNYQMYYLKYLNDAYIDNDDLLQINNNRHVNNRCPWKYS